MNGYYTADITEGFYYTPSCFNLQAVKKKKEDKYTHMLLLFSNPQFISDL